MTAADAVPRILDRGELRRRAGRFLLAGGVLELASALVMGVVSLFTESGTYGILAGKQWENFSTLLAGVTLLLVYGLIGLRNSGERSRGLDATIAGTALLALCELTMIRVADAPAGTTFGHVLDGVFMFASVLFTGGMLAFGFSARRSWTTWRRHAPLTCGALGVITVLLTSSGVEILGISFHAIGYVLLGYALATSRAAQRSPTR